MTRRPFRSIGRDLFFDICCSCDDPMFPHLTIPRTIKLTGYADDHFFDNVNALPRTINCRACGRTLKYQWFRDGVEAEFVDGVT